jgi:hypothetical protein
MTSRDFAYWLQGFFEIAKPETISAEQLTMIKNHLAMVFKHEIDPSFGDKKHQSILSQLHEGGGPTGSPFCGSGAIPKC